MTTNIKVAQKVSSDGAIITGFRYVDTNTSLGYQGTGSSPTPSTTRVPVPYTRLTLPTTPDLSILVVPV